MKLLYPRKNKVFQIFLIKWLHKQTKELEKNQPHMAVFEREQFQQNGHSTFPKVHEI